MPSVLIARVPSSAANPASAGRPTEESSKSFI
jgi:hypothetical protein